LIISTRGLHSELSLSLSLSLFYDDERKENMRKYRPLDTNNLLMCTFYTFYVVLHTDKTRRERVV